MTEPVESWVRRNHFLLRRLHSLTGIIPVGAFLLLHLYTNSLAALRAQKFDEHVRQLHELPYLLIVEIVFIFLPIAFHAAYGAFIATQGQSNAAQYWWMDNWRYTLQRVTAWIALVFIVVHLLHFRFAHWLGAPAYQETIAAGATPFEVTRAGFVASVLPTPLWVTLYSIGLIASVFHFCNGIATFCITWGITVGDLARQRVLTGSAVVGVVLLAWGFAALAALAGRPAGEPHPVSSPPPQHGTAAEPRGH